MEWNLDICIRDIMDMDVMDIVVAIVAVRTWVRAGGRELSLVMSMATVSIRVQLAREPAMRFDLGSYLMYVCMYVCMLRDTL
jgi:hypothetical protein